MDHLAMEAGANKYIVSRLTESFKALTQKNASLKT